MQACVTDYQPVVLWGSNILGSGVDLCTSWYSVMHAGAWRGVRVVLDRRYVGGICEFTD